MKKFTAILLSILLVFQLSVVSFASYAPKLSRAEWDELYDSLKDENTLPMLCVGSDQTEIRLVWHADKDNAKPEVKIGKGEAMTDAKTFKGEITEAENEEQVVCRVTVTGLEENATYFYQWNTGKKWSEKCEYKTKSFTSHKAMVIGDIQIGGQTDEATKQSDDGYTWNNVLAEALGKNPDISYLVSPGDNTSTGKGAGEWQTLLMPENARSIPMALAIGNHDKKGMMYNYYTSMPN